MFTIHPTAARNPFEIVATRLRAAGLPVPGASRPAAAPASNPDSGLRRSSLSLPPARPAAGNLDSAVQREVAAIKNDPEIQAAFANWDGLSTQQKLAIARKIARIQGDAFGFDEELDISHDPGLDARGILGLTSAGGITLSSKALASPEQLLDTIAHEEAHVYDHQTGAGLAAANHNSGPVDDAIYEIGHDVAAGVFGHAA